MGTAAMVKSNLPGIFTPRENHSTSLHTALPLHVCNRLPHVRRHAYMLPAAASNRPAADARSANGDAAQRRRGRVAAHLGALNTSAGARHWHLAARCPGLLAASMAVSGACPSTRAWRKEDGSGRRPGDVHGRAFACTLGVSLPCNRCARSGSMRTRATATPSSAVPQRQLERQIHDTNAAGNNHIVMRRASVYLFAIS